jgi:hypothetical protein
MTNPNIGLFVTYRAFAIYTKTQ